MGLIFLIPTFVSLGNAFLEHFKHAFEHIVSRLFKTVDIKYTFYTDNNVYFKLLTFDV